MPYLFVFLFGDPYKSNFDAFNIVPEISETVLNSFNSFFSILILSSYFCHSSSSSLIHSSASVILLLIPSRVFLISVIFYHCLFILYFFQISVKYVQCFLHFLHSFVDIMNLLYCHYLNSFSHRLPIPSSFIWSYSFLPCSFILNIFLCCFFLF